MAKRRKKKLLDRVRDAIRSKHYSIRTEQAYVGWVRRFILFHDKRHPNVTFAPPNTKRIIGTLVGKKPH